MKQHLFQGSHYSDADDRPHPAEVIYHEVLRETSDGKMCRHPNFWVLDYSMKGISEFKVDGLEWQERRPGTAHLYPPGKYYWERYPEGISACGHFLFRGGSFALWKLVDNSAGFAQIIDPEHQLMNSIRAGASAATNGNRGYWRFCEAFGKAMELLETLSTPDNPDWRYTLSGKNPPLPLARKVAEFLERHCRENITMELLARTFRCSKSTLAHKFKQEFGETVFNMLLRIRIEQSLPLLLRGMTLKEVAEAAGFANEFYYSRIFRKVHGVSPGEYRRF